MKNKSFIVLCSIFIGISASVLSYWCSLDYTISNLIFAGIIAFVFVGIISYNSLTELLHFLVNNKKLTVALSVFTVLVLYNIVIQYQINGSWSSNVISFSFIPVVFFSAFFIICTITKYLVTFVRRLAAGFDTWDKNTYIVLSICAFIIILILYSNQEMWFLQYDDVYSIDSGAVFNNIFPMFYYYDIRHPLMSIFTFPIYIFAKTLCDIFIPANHHFIALAIILQFINVQFILLSAFMIKKMTDNSKEMLILYLVSWSTVMFVFSFEKYQICVFFLVLYIYESIYRSNSGKCSNIVLVSAFSLMPTSSFIGIQMLFKKQSTKEKIINIAQSVIGVIGFFALFGRFSIILNGYKQTTNMLTGYSHGTWTLLQKTISLLKLWQGSMVPIASTKISGYYTWTSYYLTRISILTCIIILCLMVGAGTILIRKKRIFTYNALLWTFFSGILILFFKWSIYESQLFSFYFGWALIPIIKYGIDKIIEILRLDYIYIYTI